MENQGLITRQRSTDDERKVIIELTNKGEKMQAVAATIPAELSKELTNGPMNVQELVVLKEKLYNIINYLTNK
jgi:DNA-binding MarR family transcriptional regulator